MSDKGKKNTHYGSYERRVILDCVGSYQKKSTAFREAAKLLPGRSKNGIAAYYYSKLKEVEDVEDREQDSDALAMVKSLIIHLNDEDRKKLVIHLLKGM